MLLQKWKSPSHPAIMRDFNNRMEDLRREFNDFFSDRPLFFETPLYSATTPVRSFVPTVDIWETKNGYEIDVEAPGMLPEDVNITLEENVLVLRGKKEIEKEESDKNMIRRECSFGEFYRAIPLNHEVNPDKVRAKMKSGVLKIELEKTDREQENVRTVPIQSEK